MFLQNKVTRGSWLNGKGIHANNVTRPYNEQHDMVKVSLKKGWNQLMLKITQNDSGWGAITRVVTADGNKLEGLQFRVE